VFHHQRGKDVDPGQCPDQRGARSLTPNAD
jgi:hypothetical protein